MGDAKAAGLAKQIRASTTSDQFDLQNYDEKQLNALVLASFKEAIPIKRDMIGITFVVGGGKKVRQKYSPNMPKELANALKDHAGFTEDRGAACAIECQGTFKFQHDTDKDLKFMHVFPRVTVIVEDDNDDDEYDDLITVGMARLHVHRIEPARVCMASEMDEFKRLVVEYCPSCSQRRALLRAMKGYLPDLATIEQKLSKMESLSPEEDDLYNNTVSLQDKIQGLTSQIEGMMTRGHLTKGEIKALLPDLQEKATKLEEMMETNEKMKNNKKMIAQQTNLSEKIAALEHAQGQRSFVPRSVGIAELETELTACRKRQANLFAEDPKLEKRIDFLMAKKSGWYEDAVPKEEVKQAARKKVTKKAPSSSSSSSSSSSYNPSGGGWSMPKTSNNRGASSTSRSRVKGAGANLFSMLGDDDD